nr:TraB/VirB10 family protein [Acinetobacter terrae]
MNIQNGPVESTVPRQIESQPDPFNIIRSGKDVSKYQSQNGYKDSSSLNPTSAKELSVQAKLFLQHGLPSGSMMQGVLINGMDATAGGGKNNAVPALVRVKKNAVLPNRYSQLVKECFVIVSGVGNLATERAEMRAENLSCIFKDGQIVDSPISAYVVGEDGKTGMRGRVVSKQGSVIAKSMLAGFLGGFGKQVAPQSVPSLNVSGGDKTQYQMPNLGDASSNALAMGFGSGLDRVSNFYMNIAEQIVPVIEIDAGRQVTLILNSQFVPTKKSEK